MNERYAALLAELQTLQDEFAKFAARQTYLQHDLVLGPDSEKWDEAEFASFAEAHSRFGFADWDEWSLWPTRRIGGRYWSIISSAKPFIPVFTHLAERGFTVLAELRDLAGTATKFPQGLIVARLMEFRLPSVNTGSQEWLQLIHEWAFRFPTARLLGNCRWWNFKGPSDSDPDEVAQQLMIPTNGGTPYHSHPVCNTLNSDVFAASAEFLRCCLAPEETLPVRAHDGPPELRFPPIVETPMWMSETGELWFRDSLVKRLKSAALRQRKVLDAFQRKSWPTTILNPFKKDSVAAQDLMDDTVRDLNKGHRTPQLLHFGVQDKTQICWKAIEIN